MNDKKAEGLVRQSIGRDLTEPFIIFLMALFLPLFVWAIFSGGVEGGGAIILSALFGGIFLTIYFLLRLRLMTEYAFLKHGLSEASLGCWDGIDSFYERKHSSVVLKDKRVACLTAFYLKNKNYAREANQIAEYFGIEISDGKLTTVAKDISLKLADKAGIKKVLVGLKFALFLYLVIAIILIFIK